MMYRYPLLAAILLALTSSAPAIDSGGPEKQGERVSVELPVDLHVRNRGGSDGLGLCVFASIHHSGLWHNQPVAKAVFEYMWTQPGGGYPEKVDKVIAAVARKLNLPAPGYIQHTGGDMEFLRIALRTGRYPCVTYAGRDDYYRNSVDHMVNLVHLSPTWAVIHDNNRPGKWVWMTPGEFEQRWKDRGGGWAIVFTSPGKPPAIADPVREAVASTSIHWVPDRDDPRWMYLMDGEKHLGTWYPDEFCYKELRPDGTWHVMLPPIEPPPTNYGVDTSRISKDVGYTCNGRVCSRREAVASLGGALADDSQVRRMVFVGSVADQQRLTSLWQTPKFLKYREVFILQTFSPSDWQVAGYPMGITIVKPGASPSSRGEVIKLGEAFTTEDLLLALLEWILNPSPVSPSPAPNPPTSNYPMWIIGGLLLLLIFLGKKPSQEKS